MTVVAIGRNSFLAQAVRESGRAGDWIFLTHEEALADPSWVDKARCVVNFAFWPGFKTAPYDVAHDIDTKFARFIAGRPIHYIMISSRKVYGVSQDAAGLEEGRAPDPSDPYGRGKWRIEQSLSGMLAPERLTILRVGNVFGYEPGRKTFMGQAMAALKKDGKIYFDMARDTVRDFIDAGTFADSLVKIAGAPIGGLFNLGAGFGMPCGQVADSLIEGFGAGELVVTEPAIRDAFWLDMSKTKACYQLPRLERGDIESRLVALGRKLRQA